MGSVHNKSAYRSDIQIFEHDNESYNLDQSVQNEWFSSEHNFWHADARNRNEDKGGFRHKKNINDDIVSWTEDFNGLNVNIF